MSLKFSDLREFSPMQIARLKKEYEPMRGKTISIPNANKFCLLYTSDAADEP